MRFLRQTLVFLTAIACGACHRYSVQTPAANSMREEYCWWTVLRSSRPADSVAARFASAYISAGFSNVVFRRNADTAWAAGAPAQLAGANSPLAASRAVAYWHGDSTHFRYFVSVGHPLAPGVRSTDSVDFGKHLLDLCATIARSAAIGWSAPRSATGDEALKIWTRIP